MEASKGKLKASEELRDNCLAIQDLVIRQVLQLANPVIPHITEELWEGLGYGEVIAYIQNTTLTKAMTLEERVPVDKESIGRVTNLQELISQALALKAQYNLGIAATVIAENSGMIQTLAGLGSLEALGEKSPDGLPAIVTPLGTLYLDLTSSIDLEAEKARLTKELEKLNKLVSVGENKLKNQKFIESAPEKVVAGARKQLAETTEKRDETQRILESL